ncbi:unnamed protein product [Closterium sp. NIES-65]|nr:unnamed protein product [Closterium sp. NIES-65]
MLQFPYVFSPHISTRLSPCVPSSTSFVLPFNIPSRFFPLPFLPPPVSSPSRFFPLPFLPPPVSSPSRFFPLPFLPPPVSSPSRFFPLPFLPPPVSSPSRFFLPIPFLYFFSLLLKADEFQNTKVSDVAGSFRWAPFLPVTPDDSLLTLLLLVSKYRVRSVPVVEAGQPAVLNLVTQSSVVEVLSDCHGLPWFDRLADRPICDLGLPTLPGDKVVVVEDDAPVLEPFRRMLAAGVGGVPVVAKGTRQVVGSISVRDIQLLLVAPQLFHDCRSLTVAQFLEIAKGRGSSTGLISPAAIPPTRCRANTPLRRVMHALQAARVHRVYVTDEVGELQGVVTLRDIIGKFVVEPPDYFGDFFGGVVPDVHPTASAPMWLHADWDIGGGW